MTPTLKTLFLELSQLPGRPETQNEIVLVERVQELTAHLCRILMCLREGQPFSPDRITDEEREIFGREGFCLLPPPTITKPQEN